MGVVQITSHFQLNLNSILSVLAFNYSNFIGLCSFTDDSFLLMRLIFLDLNLRGLCKVFLTLMLTYKVPKLFLSTADDFAANVDV